MNSPGILFIMGLALLCTACGGEGGPSTAQNGPAPSMVFTMSNAEMENTVYVYMRSSDGELLSAASSPTGGTGVGHGLENQGALAVSQDGRFLYVVNPGSNDLSVFRITGTTVQLADRVPSGGTLPVSVAEWHGIVYVLNRNTTSDPNSGPAIQGFRVSDSGTLSAIPGSAVTLHAANTNAAQIGLSPDGRWLIVTERGIDQIDLVPLSDHDVPGPLRSIAAAGHGPFGFALSDSLRLYIAESTAGTTSAYDIDTEGAPLVLSAALPTQQRATCWLAISPDNRWVYVTNTASSSISSYRVAEDGTLTLTASVAATTAGPPLDVIADAGGHLSVLTRDGSIATFLIDKTSGSLTWFQTVSGLPSGTNGLAGDYY